jgi:hypothetical protein
VRESEAPAKPPLSRARCRPSGAARGRAADLPEDPSSFTTVIDVDATAAK